MSRVRSTADDCDPTAVCALVAFAKQNSLSLHGPTGSSSCLQEAAALASTVTTRSGLTNVAGVVGAVAPLLVCQTVVTAAVGESCSAANTVGDSAAVSGAARRGFSGCQAVQHSRDQHHYGHQNLAHGQAETDIASTVLWTFMVRPHLYRYLQ